MTDIIKNGSFEQGTANSDGTRFIPTDWVVPTPYNSTRVTQVCDEDENNSSSVRITGSNWNNSDYRGYPDGLPPISIQQGIDLTGYKDELVLDVEFNYSLAYNYELTTEGAFNVSLYRATSYDEDTGTYDYEGLYTDWISNVTYTMSRPSYTEMCWKNSHFIVTNLQPDFYILVFSTPVAMDTQTGTSDSFYNFVLDKVSGTVEETGRQVIQYHNILKNSTFEEQDDTGFVDWHSNGITMSVGIAAAYTYGDVNNEHGSYVCEAYCADLEYSKENNRGLKQIFHIDSYCKVEVVLDFQQYQDKSFALSVYKLLGYEEITDPEEGELPFWYVEEDEPYFQADIRAYSPSSTTFSYWENFSDVFGVEPGDYILIIHPGEETTVLDNVKVNIFTEQETGNDGTFDNPFTIQDGYFSSDGTCFFFYNENVNSKTGFILRNGSYYYCRNEVLILDEIYNNRYYHPNGVMARFESFTYEGKLYTADINGNITLDANYILDIEPYLDERMVYGPVESLDMIVDTKATIYVKYLRQSTEATPSIKNPNPNVVICTGIKPGTEYSVIEFTGKNPGSVEVSIDFTNPDGTTIGRKLNIIVFPNEAQYANPYEIFIRKSIACALLGDTLKLDYTVLPREAMGTAMFWSSSDPSVASVDQNGNVTANKIGSCVIQIYNHRLKVTRNCEFHVIQEASYPQKIKWRTTAPGSIQVGEEVRLPDYALAEFNGYPEYVIQDGYWTSSNPSVITITEYGTMIGKGKGQATITFRTLQNPSLVTNRTIEVTAPEIPIQDIELDVYEATLCEASTRGSLQIGHRFVPVNTSDTEVIWTTSNPEYTTVENGLVSLKKYVDTTTYVTIKCTSATNSSIYKTCSITLEPDAPYPTVIKTFTPNVSTLVNRVVNIEYEPALCFTYDNSFRFAYATKVTMGSGGDVPSSVYTIEHVEGSLIRFSASANGIYRIELLLQYIRDDLGYLPPITFGSKYFYVEVGAQSTDLVFVDELETVSALSNGSYILRFFVRDNRDNSLSFEMDIGGGGNWLPIAVDNCMYQGKEYSYIFGENMPIGTHIVRVRATDTTTQNSVVSGIATLIISGYDSDSRNALEIAKNTYDIAEYDIVSYLDAIITDGKIYESEELEFTTRYKTYCHNYYNLREILEVCIDSINQAIATSQGQMAMLSSSGVSAASFSANSLSVASYSVTNTNANYENVTNMDYYQNECIKQLMARVLELENKLDELTSNNN